MRRNALCLGLWLATSALVAAGADARILSVRQDGTGDHTAIQAAIDASTHGDVIEVGPGVYPESLVLGGRAIELRSTEGPERTIVDGSEASVSILRLFFSEGRSTRIVGLTLRGGRGTPLSALGGSETEGGLRVGGAVVCNPANATFENVHFVGNTANRGGGLYAGAGSAPLLVDCVFTGNSAGEGGALASAFARPELVRPVCRRNQAVFGGALHDVEGGLVCRDGWFEENAANEGGAIYLRDGVGRGRIDRCVFWRNLGTAGAALRIADASTDVVASLFADNHGGGFPTAQADYVGSGVGLLERSVFFTQAAITDVVPLRCDPGGAPARSCNLFWPKAPDACGPGTQEIVARPRLCAPGRGDFRPREDSPCLPENAPPGCGALGPETTPGCPPPVQDLEGDVQRRRLLGGEAGR